MRQWDDMQSRFVGALLDPAASPPSDVLGTEAGFAVYRNNVVSSLLDVLQDRFPVTCMLVGTEFFRAMGRLFLQQHLPSSPLLMFYGDELPDFIAAFEPAGGVPYLADVARLEVAWSRAYHAAEAKSIDASMLRTLDASTLAQSTLALHPSLQLIRSRYPVATLWAAHQNGNVSGVDLRIAEDVLIVRPEAEVSVHRVSRPAFAFVHALQLDEHIEGAARAALIEQPGFDAGAHLISLFSLGAICAIAPLASTRAAPQKL